MYYSEWFINGVDIFSSCDKVLDYDATIDSEYHR